MKWVFRIPESDIQPRDSSTPASAYVTRSRPAPPCSSGTVSPNKPSSFMPSTIFVGNSSRCSSSSATGITSRSTNSRTAATTASCSSVSVTSPDTLSVLGDGSAGQPRCAAARRHLLGHLAARLVDHLGPEHHRARALHVGRVGVGLDDRLGLVELLMRRGEDLVQH